MKKFIALLTAFALPVMANDVGPFEFEITPSCIWNKNTAVCIVHNQYNNLITCTVSIQAKSLKGITTGNTRQLVISAQKFMDVKVFAPEGDAIIAVSGFADCKA